jgi:hypothetical protein
VPAAIHDLGREPHHSPAWRHGVTPDIKIRFDPSSHQTIYEVEVVGYCKT